NTAHYCSLLMPAGMQADTVYQALRRVEETLDRNWKHTPRDKVQAVQPAVAVASLNALSQKAMVTAMADVPPPTACSQEHLGERGHALAPAVNGAIGESAGLLPGPGPTTKARSPIKGWVNDPKQVEFLLMAVDTLDSKRGAIRDN